MNRASLKARGLNDDDLKIEGALLGAFDLDLAFASWIWEKRRTRASVFRKIAEAPRVLLLGYLGYTERRSTRPTTSSSTHYAEGALIFAPSTQARLREPLRQTGQRYSHRCRTRMMAPTQPFLSGAISGVNLPNEATIEG